MRRTWDDILVCPFCKGKLDRSRDAMACRPCVKSYGYNNGFIDFSCGEKFEDEETFDLEKAAMEERTDRHIAINYLFPLLDKLQKKNVPSFKMLSVGCGVAIDVDLLNERGFPCWGVDCGSRTAAWPYRKNKDKLFIANGKNLPFKEAFFDFVFAGAVIEHVGVVGDTYVTKPDFLEDRIQFAQELIKIVKPGGHIVVSCPNRTFPLDLFHRTGGAKSYIPRLHSPKEPFLLSFDDLKNLFVQRGGCKDIQALPIDNYWGFYTATTVLLGRILYFPVRAYFKFLSYQASSFLRSTFLNPWLVILVTK